jgi:hypothetical protein
MRCIYPVRTNAKKKMINSAKMSDAPCYYLAQQSKRYESENPYAA